MLFFQIGGSGDPHFIQIVNDRVNKVDFPICYDVSGSKGDKILIIHDNFTDSRVYGVLLDDDYMHEINKIYSS